MKSESAPAEEVELLADAQHYPGFPEDCSEPSGIRCRTVDTHELWNETADAASVDVNTGLRCINIPFTPLCLDYECSWRCCGWVTVTCSTPSTTETTTTIETTTEGSHINQAFSIIPASMMALYIIYTINKVC